MTQAEGPQKRSRTAAIVGPRMSGKTTLLEALLYATEAIPRKGAVNDGASAGDASPEARARKMSTEVGVFETSYLGDTWTFLDCPGSIEFEAAAEAAALVADVAIVVVEPDPARAVAAAPILHFLEARQLPYIIFVNKMDQTDARVRDIVAAYKEIAARPLLLRHVPIRDGDEITGYMDLVAGRSYAYKPGARSEQVKAPASMADRTEEGRMELLEALADFDDGILEKVLEDVTPEAAELYVAIAKDVGEGLAAPVLIGSAETDGGVRRLLKALRHDCPSATAASARRGIVDDDNNLLVQAFRTYHAPQVGKLSYVRVLSGRLGVDMEIAGRRIGAIHVPRADGLRKIQAASVGDVVALGRVEDLATGDLATEKDRAPAVDWPSSYPKTHAVALHAENRNDEVKLMGALSRIVEEDPSLAVEQRSETSQLLLWGQGETHVAVALDRLKSRFNLSVAVSIPRTPYRETIRKGADHHARFKRQTGGHGQFGDVQIEVRPLPRGEGFAFENAVVGGAVPRQYIPAVEAGVTDALAIGPLGFPVVDVAVTLKDGKHHPVDSSEQAFRTAGRMAMAEALPDCQPVLLEPICKVSLFAPSEHTAALQRLAASRRGQILGFDARAGWTGWDRLDAYMPEAEIHGLIQGLRSQTMGLGGFDWEFDHLQELSGRVADDIVANRKQAAE